MQSWKRFGLVSLVLAIIVMAGGYGAWKYHRAKFTAQAFLQVSAQVPHVLFQAGETGAGADYQRYQLTQMTFVKSQLVLNAALEDRAVSAFRMIRKQADPVAWLHDNLEVGFVGGSEVLRIALSGNNADEVAGIVNAVKKAYLEEVVNVDVKRQSERHDTLKKLRIHYQEILHERRRTLQKLAETVPSDDGLEAVEREKAELLVSHTLWSERLKLRLEQAEAETLLARRKEVGGAATDAVRKEIVQIEDRLAVVMARQKVLDWELEEVNHSSSIRPQVVRAKRDLVGMKTEIAMLEESERKVAAEVEKLNVELSAPPRVRTIENAVPPRTRG